MLVKQFAKVSRLKMERKRKENIKIDNSDSTKEVFTLKDDVNSDEMEELD